MGLEFIANHVNQYEEGINQARVISEFNARPALFMNVKETSEKKARSFLERLGIVTSAYCAEKAGTVTNNHIDDKSWSICNREEDYDKQVPVAKGRSRLLGAQQFFDLYSSNEKFHSLMDSIPGIREIVPRLFNGNIGDDEFSFISINSSYVVIRVLTYDFNFTDIRTNRKPDIM